MIKLYIIPGGRIQDYNGAVLYGKRLVENEKEFKKRGIDVVGDYSLKTAGNNIDSNKVDEKSKLSRFKKALHGSYLGSCVIIFYSFFLKGTYKQFRVFLKEEDSTDVTIVQDLPSAFYYNKHGFFSKKKTIFVMHNNGDALSMLLLNYPLIKGRRFYKWLIKLSENVFKKSDKIIFVSEQSRMNFVKNHDEYKNKAIYIPMGIIDRAYKEMARNTELKLITVGTICERKNQIAIIKALERLNNPNIYLSLIGTGDKQIEYEQYVREKKIKNIRFLGAIENAQIHSCLLESNCFIMSSFDEGLPTAAVEAMRAGLPLILTDVGGCNELISGNGHLVQTDVESIANAIITLYNELDNLQAYGKRSRELFLQKYEMSAMVDTYSKIIQSLF